MDEISPADFLTAALNDEITEEELDVVDRVLESMMQDTVASANVGNGKPLLTVAEAQAKLAPGILKVLADKFKGSLIQVRHKDSQDQMF